MYKIKIYRKEQNQNEELIYYNYYDTLIEVLTKINKYCNGNLIFGERIEIIKIKK